MNHLELTARLFTALLSLLPPLPASRRPCVERRHDAIVAAASATADARAVPVGLLLSVALFESHWGCAPGSGSCWGAPVDTRHRLTAGTPDHAAAALARSFAVCGTWTGAVGRFRAGLCRPWQAAHRAYVARVMRYAARTYDRAAVPVPSGL